MRSVLYSVLFMMQLALLACSSEEANVSVAISQAPLPLIPASAISCVATKNSGGDVATPDIAPSYFKVPKVTLSRKDTSKALIVALIRIKIQIPGGQTPVLCEVGGDSLAALSSVWWANGNKEALIPEGTDSFSTDCSLYCGGVNSERPYTATGTFEIFGLERDSVSLEETPVKVQTAVTIQSY